MLKKKMNFTILLEEKNASLKKSNNLKNLRMQYSLKYFTKFYIFR